MTCRAGARARRDMRLPEARPHSLSPRGLAIAGWSALAIALATFVTLAWNVATHAPLVEVDAHVAEWLAAHRIQPLTSVLLVVTQLNSLAMIGVWSAVFAGVLAWLRERYWMLTLVLAVGGGMLLNLVLKLAYERARPRFDDPLLELHTFSFPSGHTAAATVFYGVLAAFLVSRFRDPAIRIACVAGAVAAVTLVAFSRIYLGAHYLSDVIAAACSSTVWLVACLSGVHSLVRRRMDAR